MKRTPRPDSSAPPLGVGSPALVAGQVDEPVRVAFKREHALFSNHRYPQALVLLTDLLARPDLTSRQRFEALCRKADCLEHLQRPKAAVELLREVTRAHRDEVLGFSLLGEYLYEVMDDCAGALRALRRALRLNPKDPDSLWWRGQVYQLGLAKLALARKSYRAALESDPGYAPAMDSMASVAEAEGKWIEAIDWRKNHYRRTRQAHDLVQLAELYLRLGNVPAAQKYARQASKRAPGLASGWLVLAKALAAGRRLAHGAEALKRFTKLAHPRSGPFVYSRDFAWLEPLLDRPEVQALLPRIPKQ